MANKIQIKRGLAANLPVLSDGEPAWTTDTFRMYVGQGGVNKLVGEADFLKLGGGTLTGALTLAGDPTLALQAATKQYVDGLIQGIKAKMSVHVASTGNLTLSGEQTIDFHAISAGERVLVKDQTDPKENGIYTVAAGAWSRSADADTWDKLISAFTWVEQGGTHGDTGWLCTVDWSGTLETTAVTFVQFSGAGQITAGTGLTKTGNTINLGGGDGLNPQADIVHVNLDAAAGLKFDASTPKKIQVNIASDLEFSSNAIRIKAFTGDVTKTAGGTALTIATAAVTLAKMANLAQNTIIGRVTASAGVPEALTAANVRTIINVADGATANAKATGAELDTGTDDVKFATAKALKDSHNVPSVPPGANGNVLVSNGTDWTSAPASSHTQNTDTGTTADIWQFDSDGTVGATFQLVGTELQISNRTGATGIDFTILKGALASGMNNIAGHLGLYSGSGVSKSYIGSSATALRIVNFPDLAGTVLLDTSAVDGGTW